MSENVRILLLLGGVFLLLRAVTSWRWWICALVSVIVSVTAVLVWASLLWK